MINIKSIFTLILLLHFHLVKSQVRDTVFSNNLSHPLVDFDPQKPPFKFENEQLTNRNRFLRFSVLTGYREGVAQIKGATNFYFVENEANGTHKIYMNNLSIEDMLTHGLYPPKKVILEVKQPSRYRYDPVQGTKEEWMRKNAYCFEWMLPLGTLKGSSALNKELGRVLGLKFGPEKRLVNTLVLFRTSNKEKFRSLGGKQSLDYKSGRYINGDISCIRKSFDSYGGMLFLNAVNLPEDFKIDMELNISDWNDIPAVRRALQRYDLDLKEEKREFDMFVIREPSYKNVK